MFLQTFASGPYATNAYLVGCPATKQAAVIDPSPRSATSIFDCLRDNSFSCDKILLTHSHWDHIADIPLFKQQFPEITVSVHPLDKPNLEKPGSDGLPFRMHLESVTPDFLLHDGDRIRVGNLIFSVIHTPGHSPGSVCFYCAEENILFSGDTLFAGTIGNLSFPTSEPDAMWISLDKLHRLPPQTKVYPGHGSPTTIGAESWLPNAKTLFS